MISSDANVKTGLSSLGLDNDEAEVYLALLKSPVSPLELSRGTGIARTKIYNILEALEERSLALRQADDRGTFYAVTEPVNLGIQLAERESKLKSDKDVFHQILPMLNAIRGSGRNSPFVVRTYGGAEGFKQMLWHELKAKGELLSLGGGDLEELVPDEKWAQRLRQRTVEAGFRVREIINSEIDLPTPIEDHDYLNLYVCRGISAHTLPLENQITVYNNTVAVYSWRHDKRVGVEIVSRSFASTMRAMFEYFWAEAKPASSRPLNR